MPQSVPSKTQRKIPKSPNPTPFPQIPSQQDSSSQALALAAPGSTQVITHIVLFKYKPSISWEVFEEHFETFKALQQRCLHPVTQRPYMLSVRMGKNRSWEPFSKGMTHAFALEFASQDDLD